MNLFVHVSVVGLRQVISGGDHSAAVSHQRYCSSELPHTCWGESILKSAHKQVHSVLLLPSLCFTDINSPLRRWSRPVFTLWEGVQRCSRSHSALTLADGAKKKAKKERGQGFVTWRLGSGRGSVSGGGSLRTRCSSCSCT